MIKDRPRFWSFPRGGAWVLAGLVIAGSIAFQGVEVVAAKYDQPKLDALYSIMRELRLGMAHGQVLEAVRRHSTPAIEQHAFENGDITLEVRYGLFDSCSLAIGFKAGALERARTVG